MSEQLVYFEVHEQEWTKEFRSTKGMVGKDLDKRAQKLRIYAIRQMGHKTGRLARTMKVFLTPSPDGPLVLVGSDDSIALIHHNGTRPHIERAKPGRMLRFTVRGKVVYAQKVFNRGTRPNRYLTDNLRRVIVD